MSSSPRVVIIVLNWNNWPVTVECLESLGSLTYPRAHVLLVDNGSTDGSERILREKFPAVEIFQTGSNRGYAGGNNAGMRRALELGADYLCLLNNDVVVEPGFLEPLVAAMEADPRLGIAGGLQCSYDDRGVIQNSGVYVNFLTGRVRNDNAGETNRGQCNREKEVDFICGAALLARAAMARSVGLLDDSFFMVCEDADWGLRARRAGWSVRFIPGSKIFHKERATRDSHPGLNWYYVPRNQIWLERRHGSTAQLVIFVLLSLGYFWPRQVVGRLLKREGQNLWSLLGGLRDGFGALPPDPVVAAEAQHAMQLNRAVE